MNVSIRHNGTNISTSVVSYEREHKICTGIGTLTVVVERTIGANFEPWDEIDIYENGSFQVKYYVSSVTEDLPKGTITLDCQDESKRIVDYFIPDSYTIDYPSYTRYWIEKFLDEINVNYQFRTSSQGNLLPNFTQLGLKPAYEQILNLLQLSGWYMYFDGNGKAIIGSLSTDLGSPSATYNKDDILNIAVKYDDKMLRNRAVVWGSFDPFRQEYAYADIRTHTRWNYDHNDYRTMVVSNNNIPNKSSAYGIANKLIKEFSRITIEKSLTIHGASNRNLGDVVRVRSNIFKGTGLITTFGVSMSRNGLVTNLILDERCPRLFGFFDFGDWVYVGTYGDGVWRKHIKFEHSWHPFSSGLMDLAVTDLHINNDVFGAIAASGDTYYAESSDGPWILYNLESLSSSAESQVDLVSGELPSGLVLTSFSGLMGRAVIVDKQYNTVKWGVDTYSGLNFGDYFMMHSGFMAIGVPASGMIASGVAPSGGYRSWIIEYDPYNTISGVYPVHYSGHFDMMVVDLENDGLNDYVSVRARGEFIPNNGTAWNFGSHTSQPFASTRDPNEFSVTPENIQYVEDNTTGFESFIQACSTRTSLMAIDNQLSEEMEIVSVRRGQSGNSGQYKRTKLTRTITGPHTTNITRNTTTSSTPTFVPSSITDGSNNFLGIRKISYELYRFYIWEYDSTNSRISVKSQEWDTYNNVVASSSTILTMGLNVSVGIHATASSSITIGDTAYLLFYYTTGPSGSAPSSQTYIYAYIVTVDLLSGAASGGRILEFILPRDTISGTYFFVPSGNPSTSGSGKGFDTQPGTGNLRPMAHIDLFQNGENGVKALGWVILHHHRFDNGISTPYRCRSKEYIITGESSSLLAALAYDTEVVEDVAERFYSWLVPTPGNLQLTADKAVIVAHATANPNLGAGSKVAVYFTGSDYSYVGAGASTFPDQLNYYKIFPILNTESSYITKTGSNTFYLSDATNPGSLGDLITPPANIFLNKPFSSPLHSLAGEVYFGGFDDIEFEGCLIPFFDGAFQISRKLLTPGLSFTNTRGINIGGMFIQEPANWSNTDPECDIAYVDMLNPYDNAVKYMVLQREETEYNLIRESERPIRVDISNSSPVLSLLGIENTYKSHYIYDNQVATVSVAHSFSGAPGEVRDYRYTLLEVPSGGIVPSGIMEEQAADKLVLYVLNSGVYYTQASTLASGFTVLYPIPSGIAERIETSNFIPSGQYIFVTTSGDSPSFYQKDPADLFFVSYSGLPVSRATIIRVDDRF